MFTSFFLNMLNREASSKQSRAEEVLERLHILEGQAVADIGSGGGYFTLAFSRMTGKTGRVYAVDVKKTNLSFIRRQAERAGLGNIVFVLADKGMKGLPEAGLDLIFARNVFHHLPGPTDYFAGLKQFLKPDGRVAIIEHQKKGFGFVSLFGHHTSQEAIAVKMKDAGYSRTESFDILPRQSFTLFKVT